MKPRLIFPAITFILLISIILALSLGAVSIPLKEVPQILYSKIMGKPISQAQTQYESILFIVRFPRVILSVLVGAALGISGSSVQAIFRNPLAEPALIGISAGASLMAIIIISIQSHLLLAINHTLGHYSISVSAMLGALLSSLLVFNLSKTNNRNQVSTMLLVGIAINAFCSAIIGLITANSEDSQIRSITFWMLGSLSGASWEIILIIIPFILPALILLPLQARNLNAFALGERQAQAIGIDTDKTKKITILLCTLCVGASVSFTGIIGFVGLLVPHLTRLISGVDNKKVLPLSAIIGAIVLCLADLLSRIISIPMEQPIGVITALIGSPVFLYLLIKDKKNNQEKIC